MKNNKLNKVWIAGLAALVILILLLTMCSGPEKENVETQPTQTTSQPAQETTEQIRETEETTETTEETTEATEETTEATEETTGSSSSGSTDSDDSDSTTSTEAALEVPDPGEENNPYVEVVSEYPGTVHTVSIPASGNIHYLISGSAGNVITIAHPDAKLVCGEKTYTADENGTVTADLSELTADAVISVTNVGQEALAYELKITEPLGAKTNPVILSDLSQILVALKAGDSDGCYYQWTAPAPGILTLALKAGEEPALSPAETQSGEVQASAAETLLSGSSPGSASAEAAEIAELAAVPQASQEEAADDNIAAVSAAEPAVEIIAAASGKEYKLSDSADGSLSLELDRQETVLIQVIAVPDAEGNYPEASAEIQGSFAIHPGTLENPYEHTLTGIPETFTTVEIPSESQVFYRITGAAGTVLTIADQACVIYENVTYGPAVNNTVWVELPADQETVSILLEVGNQNKEAKALTLKFAYKGSAECPARLTAVDQIDATLSEGSEGGYYYQWTAADPGTAALKLESIAPENAVCDVTLSVSGTDRVTRMVDGAASIELAAGETLIVHIAPAADESGAYPAAQVRLSGTFAPAPGTSADNPIVLSDLTSDAAIAVPAGRTVYLSGLFQGRVLTIGNGADAAVILGEQTVTADEAGTITIFFPEAENEEAITFGLTSASDGEFWLHFAYPEGSEQNPAEMILGENQAQLEENDADGYLFGWTAVIDGELTITMAADDQWQYTLNGEHHTSAEDPQKATVTIAVTAGQEIRLSVNTLGEEGTPAGTVRFTASFYDPTLGTEANPIFLELTDEITIPAGGTVYYTSRVDGMTLTLTGENVSLNHNGSDYTPENGVITLLCRGNGILQPPVFAITNQGEEAVSCTVEFTYPLGHGENPDQLKLGQTHITLASGDEDGYSFVWTAEEAGTFTITMAEGAAWQYVVSNLTTGVSGEHHVSGDDPAVLCETIEVSAGDEIHIAVNTYDGENPYAPPGGEITFVTAFAAQAAA